MKESIKETLILIKTQYKNNPGWYWLEAIIFLFPLLPEYISPFILFAGFIVFKIQWSKEKRKAKIGNLGKLMMLFMGFAILSTLWSDTKFSTFATASLWWGLFLIQVMIFNLVRSRDKIDKILRLIVSSAAISGLVGTVQIITYTMAKCKILPKSLVLVTPIYKNLDKAIYTALPFDIRTNIFSSRASSFFSNPNLFATYMVLAYPISIYRFLNAKTKKQRIICLMLNILISAGLSSTLTRAGCIIVILGWIFMFAVLFKRYHKQMLQILVPTIAIIVPSILKRYGIIFSGTGKEAKKSTASHFKIWSSLIDYLTEHINAFLAGTGFGCEQTGIILYSMYDLNKPHAHNFIIEIWTELGVIGIILLFTVIMWTLGKLLEINSNNSRKFTLTFCVFTSLLLYLCFGLSDFIFNSPKQIIYLFVLIGITQSISYCYDKTIIKDAKSLEKAALREIKNTIHQ